MTLLDPNTPLPANIQPLRILVGCEYSGVVRDAFKSMGHDAWSCDLLPTESAGNHLQMDIVEAITGFQWEGIILHPPCTALGLCGNAHYGKKKPKHAARLTALEWTASLWNLACNRCERVALENPKNVLGAKIGRKTQTIHPWQFGHPEQKETWLWLRGFQPLRPTKIVYEEMMKLPKCRRERIHYMAQSESRGHERSLTFTGIATAMAEQWSVSEFRLV